MCNSPNRLCEMVLWPHRCRWIIVGFFLFMLFVDKKKNIDYHQIYPRKS